MTGLSLLVTLISRILIGLFLLVILPPQTPSVTVFDNNLVQLVDSPTHVGGNVLDLVLTTDDQLIEDLCVCKPNQSFCSDHLMITFNYSHRSSPPNSQQLPRGNSTHFVFYFPKVDMEGLHSYLETTDFSVCFRSSDIDTVWSTLKVLILNAMELFIPKIRVKTHQYHKCFTSDIRHSINCLCTLRRKCKKNTLLLLI